MVRKSITILFVLLVAAPVFCFQDAGTPEVTQLQDEAQSLDETATQAGNEKVFQTMSEQLGIPAETLMAQKTETEFGFGNLFIANSLAQASGKEFSVLAEEFKSGAGWGEIAKRYDLKLGSVVSDMRRSQQSIERSRGPRAGGEQRLQREQMNKARQSNRKQERNSTGRGRP